MGIYKLVSEQVTHAPYPTEYRIATRWQILLRSMLTLAGRKPDARLLAHLGLRLFDLDPLPLTEDTRRALVQRRRAYNQQYPELGILKESFICANDTIVAVDAGSHSEKLDQALSYYEHIYAGVPKNERLDTILEIGSGYGRFARLMRDLDPRRCYILADLPESLVFAYAFLCMNFPSARMLFVASAAEATTASRNRFDFVFCPIQFLASLTYPKIDLLINTYSFAEMPQASVDYLIGCVHTLGPRYFYSLNMMFTDRDVHFDTGGLDGEAAETTLVLEPEWRIRSFELIPATIDGLNRLTAAAVLERIDDPSDDTAIAEAATAAEQLPAGSAARIANLYFAAIWSGNSELFDRFIADLRLRYAACGFPCNPDRVGEVRHLKRMLTESAECSSPRSSAASC